MTMSAASASEQPAPAQGPWTAATTGSGQGEQRLDQRIEMRLQRGADIVGQAAARGEVGAARKAAALRRPAAGSARPSRAGDSTAARSSSSIAALSALSESGRLSVTVATAAGLSSSRICSKSMRAS